MFGLGKKKVEDTEPQLSSEGQPKKTEKLVIHIGEVCWVARIVSANAQKPVQSFKGTELDVEKDSSARIEKIIQVAFETIPDTALKEVGEILLLLDDPKIIISDYGPVLGEGVSPGAIRDFGKQHLNVKEATFGSMMYGAAEDEKQIFAFKDVQDLRHYLGALDQYATLITKVIPSTSVFVSRTQTQTDKVHATLYVSDMSSSFVAIDSKLGQVFVRTVPVGTLSLVKAISEEKGVSLSDARTSMEKQDYVKDLRLGEELKPEDEILLSSYVKILRPLLNDIIENVSQSITYFEAQKLGGAIESIEIFGDFSSIRGLDRVIEKCFPVPGKRFSEMPIDLLCNDLEADAINLLVGSSGNLFSVGKMKYKFSETHIISSTDSSEYEGFIPQNIQEKFHKLTNDGFKSVDTVFGLKISKFMPKHNVKTVGKKRANDALEQTFKEDRMFFALFGLFMVTVLYVGWTYLDEVQTQYANTSGGISGKVKNNAVLRSRISPPGMRATDIANHLTVDKVLWSEKFLSIADNMDNAMWISDIYLADDTRLISGKTVRSKKLTLEGAILPSTIGHILEISEYMQRLENDKDSFMEDFSDITFGGAKIDTTEREHIVRFSIDAWYDKTKRKNLRN